MDEAMLQNLKNVIAQLETSGGKNLKHRQIKEGIHSGDSAIGKYALMPNTILEEANIASKDQLNPDIAELKKLNKEDIHSKLQKQPELQEEIASRMLGRILKRQGNNIGKTLYSWRKGTNIPTEAITPEKLQASGYVQKGKELFNDPALEPLRIRALRKVLENN
jgi:hypothetical protein